MYRVTLCLVAMLVATITAVALEEKPMEEQKSLKVGMVAPDFTLTDDSGEKHNLRDYLGKKNVVLAFYPKDFTGG